MRLRIAAPLVVLAAALAACDNPFASSDASRVRVENASNVVLGSVEVLGAGAFGTLEPGEVTGYVRVDDATGFPSVTAVVDGERVTTLDPLIAMQPLERGRYTYVVTFSPASAHLEARTRADG